jgi:hypothetical protein
MQALGQKVGSDGALVARADTFSRCGGNDCSNYFVAERCRV